MNSTTVSSTSATVTDPVDRWLFAAAFVVSLSFTCGLVLADPDLWGHTLYGMRALERGVLCEATDPFSYTAFDSCWVNHEWLTEMQLGWLWPRYGNLSLWIWRNVWVLLIFLCVASEMRRQRASLAAKVVLLCYGAECLSQFVLFVRPQVPTFALFAITLLVLKRHSDGAGKGEIWTLPLLQIMWVNMHGGFLAGLGVIGIHAALEIGYGVWNRLPWKLVSFRLSLVFALSLLATLINPYGLSLYAMLWEHLATEQLVVEWQPLWAARQAPTYYVPLILLVLSLPLSRRWTWLDAAVLTVIGIQAISHIRHVALLAIACLILLPAPLTESLPRLFPHLNSMLSHSVGRKLKYMSISAALGLLVVLQIRGTSDLWLRGLPPWEIAVETRSPVPGMPVRAVKFLKVLNLSGNLLTDYGWAQFVIWHAPEFKVAFDGRYRTVYSAQLEQEFLSFLRVSQEKPAQTPFLDKYPTEFAVLPINASPTAYLRQRADWEELYQDDQAVIFVRRIPRFDSLLERKRKGELPIVDTPVWQSFPANTGLPD
jgi:hypothetical protein